MAAVPVPTAAVPQNGSATVVWPHVTGATSYDVSTDGGTTFTNQAALVGTNYTQFKNVTWPNGTPVNFIVRSKDASVTSAWSGVATTTPSSTRYVVLYDDGNRTPSTTSMGTPPIGTYAGSTVWGPNAAGRIVSNNVGTPGSVTITSNTGSDSFDAQFYMPTSTGGLGTAFLINWTNTNSYAAIMRDGNDGSRLALRMFVSGSAGPTIPLTDTYVPSQFIRFVGYQGYFFVFLDGVLRFKTENLLAGRGVYNMGFYANSGGGFDDVIIWNTPPASFDPQPTYDGFVAHVYKGHDIHTQDTGSTP